MAYNQTLYTWMEMEYASLNEGATLSGQECPLCKARGVMSVSRIHRQLLWMCHRASCQFRRGKTYGGFVPDKPPEDERVVVYPDVLPLPEAVYDFLDKNYHLSRRSINRAGMGFLPDHRGGDRMYFPIRDAASIVVGYNAKALSKDVQPKSVTKSTLQSAIAWYPNTTRTRKVLVVEDQLSAIRASEHLTSCAILGTHLNDERMRELLAFGPEEILLALDADAFAKAVKYVVQFKAMTGGRMKVIPLKQDVKNMSPETFEEFIHENCSDK